MAARSLPPFSHASKQPHRLRWAFALAIVTALLFLPCVRHDFINYDDPSFVTENPWVRSGLSWSGIQHAFTHASVGNWQPLTWLSHMLDGSLFGLRAAGHHFSSVLLHSLNAALLFLLLTTLTQAPARSFVVAAIFALHPLRVESVAWVTARKDVLSALFWMLAMLAYVRFAKGIQPRRMYACSLLAFAFGLMSKPMIITLPIVLLLLDGWPLARASVTSWKRLLLEKLPFVILAIASAIITMSIQPEAVEGETLFHLPLAARVQHAALSYWLYISKFIAPVGLAVIYPHPVWNPVWQVILATIGLGVVTALVTWKRREMPWLLVGWLWFVVTLLPMIGLVQVGRQSMADRFTYLPMIGLCLMLVWAVSEANKRRPTWAIAAAVLCVGCSALLTANQLAHWRNSETLFHHVLAVTDHNETAHMNLGTALMERGANEEAAPQFQAALVINAQSAQAHFNLGATLDRLHRSAEALEHYQACVRLQPASPRCRFALGAALLAARMTGEALTQLQEAVRLDPTHVDAHLKLGSLFFEARQLDEALKHFEACARLRPDLADAQNNIGSVFFMQGKLDEASPHYREALRLNPAHLDASRNLEALLQIKASKSVQ